MLISYLHEDRVSALNSGVPMLALRGHRLPVAKISLLLHGEIVSRVKVRKGKFWLVSQTVVEKKVLLPTAF
jgi:hypothetical protein